VPKIIGVDGMTRQTLAQELQRGARFVSYQYVISALIITFRKTSDIYYIPPGASPASKGWPWTLLTLCVGWLGFPWGFIYTPMAIYKNLTGGIDVTDEVAAQLLEPVALPSPAPAPVPDAVVAKRECPLPDRVAYLVTFQSGGGQGPTIEVEVTGDWYQYLNPGDYGTLSLEGDRFWNFLKVG
jgi:hypothetical protein